jgi:hypothetical protein
MSNPVISTGVSKTLGKTDAWSYIDSNGDTQVLTWTGDDPAISETDCATHKEESNYGTVGCTGHASVPNDDTSFTTIVAGSYIKAIHIDELRTAIVNEIDRRNAHEDFNYSNTVAAAGNPDVGDNIDNANLKAIDDVITHVDEAPGSIPADNTKIVLADVIPSLRARINALENDCVCNSDCACNTVCTCNTDCQCNYSDIRLKTEIEELDKGLEFISSLDTYKFKYKDNDLGIDSLYTHYGLMAQEISDTNIVHTEASSGYKKVNYIELIPVLINAIKELSEKIDGK